MKKKICIIGCGTFGSYLLKRLLDNNAGGTEITVVEIGHRKTKTESEIGLDSISKHSTVSKNGRYFGFGGTSARWGGQVLFFDERDNPEDDENWREIVRINNRYKVKVLEELLGENSHQELLDEHKDIKTGVWLKYASRNLYNRLGKRQLKQVNMLSCQRVVDFEVEQNNVKSVVCKSSDGRLTQISADEFYLTAGALESCRLLMVLNEKYDVLSDTDIGLNFGDHISTELFHINNAPPVLNGIDFTPRLCRGSLITRRMIVRTEAGTIGFLHGVFNKDVKAFKFLKELLFGKRTTTVSVGEFIYGIKFLFKFGFNLLFRKRLYIDHAQWSLQLDMEQPVPNDNRLLLTEKKDRFGEAVLQIDWDISASDMEAIAEMRQKVEDLLRKHDLNYTPLFNPASTENKVEDVYHPVGCLRAGHDERAVVNYNGRVKGIGNLYHFSTGMFPSAKSINPSAAVCCFIEEHLANHPAVYHGHAQGEK